MGEKVSNARNARETKSVEVRRDTLSTSAGSQPVPASSELRLEVSQDEKTGAFVYNIFDAKTGALLGQWSADQMVALREYIRQRQLTLFDKSV